MHPIWVIGPIIFCVSLLSIVDSVFFDPFDSIGIRTRSRLCPLHKCNNETESTVNSNMAGCRCDVQCPSYGDCCQDAPMSRTMNLTSLPVLNCSSIPSVPYPIYMISWCPPSAGKQRTRICQGSSDYTEQTSDPQTKVPVTDLTTNITYGNKACARCQQVWNFNYWSLNFTCPSHNETIKLPRPGFISDHAPLPRRFTFNNEKNVWQYTNEKNVTETCAWVPVPPDRATSSSLRQCQTNVVNECFTADANPPSPCPGYVAYVTTGGKFYKNMACALCNNRNINIQCQSPQPLQTLPTTSVNSYVDSTSPGTTRSSTTTRTTPPVTSSSTSSSSTTPPSTITSTFIPLTSESSGGERPKVLKNKKRAYMYIQFDANCDQIMHQMNITRVAAETVYYETLNRTFVKHTKKIVGTAVEVCDMTKKGAPTEWELGVEEYRWFIFVYIVYDLFLCASALLILIYLYLYAVSKMSSTMYSRALASFAFTLFLAHAGTIINSIVTLSPIVENSKFCLLDFLLEYYGHLAARFWLVSIAFEVTACIGEIGGGDGFSTSGAADGRWTRFTFYSWLSWLGPGIIIGTKMCFKLNTITADPCFLAYEIDFHQALVLPSAAVSVSMTTALYASSLYAVRTRGETLEKLSKAYGIDFSLYTILIVCAALVNLTVYTNNDSLLLPEWLLFCTLNCMVAISICLHSCTQNALLNNAKLYVDEYIKRLIL